MQLEFDEQIAEALLADDELELELEVARARSASGAANPVFRNLDDARERFIDELQHLKEGENPAPYVENFLPAVLPALRIAITPHRPAQGRQLPRRLPRQADLESRRARADTRPLARDRRCRAEAGESRGERMRTRRGWRRPRWPRRSKRRSAASRRCPITCSTDQELLEGFAWRRSSRRRPPTCRPCSRRRPTEGVRSCWKAASTRHG